MDELGSTSLRAFLRTAGTLSATEKRLIAEQALTVLEQNYAHLPLKAARYALNPLQRLRLLIARLARGTQDEPEWRFHAELLDIFNSLRDLHTRYVLPEPFAKAVAFLPFRVKEFTADATRHFHVAPLREDNRRPVGTVPSGVELLTWNGVPMDRALDVFGDRLPGANPAARRAQALDKFTVRSLGFAGPPDEEFVVIQFLDHNGVQQETREAWRVALPTVENQGAMLQPAFEDRSDLEVDEEAATVAWLKTLLLAPDIVEQINSGADEITTPGGIGVSKDLGTCFDARVVPDLVPAVGHIRIRNFTPPEGVGMDAFVDEFIRLLGQMPPAGVIIDIRGNGGGNAVAAEMCLQAMTARRIESQPLQFITSPLNLRICRNSPVEHMEDLRPWLPSMEQALESGAVHSAGLPRASASQLARVPQAHLGPVLLVTDGRVYSAADRFAAGFQDNELGIVLGVDGNTGAGGANVWTHSDLIRAMTSIADSPYVTLPAGAGIRVAMRRTLRVGRHTGAPVEDFGVEPDQRHHTTRDDILRRDVDLMTRAAELLRQPLRRFEVGLEESPSALTLAFDVENVQRADVYADSRPRGSVDLTDGAGPVVIPVPDGAREVRVVGLATGNPAKPVAVRIFRRNQAGRLVLQTALM